MFDKFQKFGNFEIKKQNLKIQGGKWKFGKNVEIWGKIWNQFENLENI